MQYFQDPNERVYAFESDVAVSQAAGGYSFRDARGTPLPVPANLSPCANNTPPGLTLAQAQAVQAVVMKAACAKAISTGFTSAALGSACSYGSQPVDQTNIAAAAASANGGALWCADSGGAWRLTAHAAAQAQQVRSDLWAHNQAAQAHYANLLAQITAATTVAAVQAVIW